MTNQESILEVEHKVRDHFHNDEARFDSIYNKNNGPVASIIDNHWLRVIERRLKKITTELLFS